MNRWISFALLLVGWIVAMQVDKGLGISAWVSSVFPTKGAN